MSKKVRENSDSNSADLLALLDRTKERLLNHNPLEHNTNILRIETGPNTSKLNEFELSSVSSHSINEISRNNLLDQIAEIKEMFRAQELVIDSMQNEFTYSPKSPKSPKSPLSPRATRSPRSPRSPHSPHSPRTPDSPKAFKSRKKPKNPVNNSNAPIPRISREGISSIESAFGRAMITNKDEDEDYSVFASTLLGLGSEGIKKGENSREKPVLKFLAKSKPFVFKKKVLLRGCISVLNL